MSSQLRLLPTSNQLLYGDAANSAPHADAAAPFSDDLRIVVETLRMRAGLFFVAFGSVVVSALVWLNYAVPLYSATATIVLDAPRQIVPNSPMVLEDVEPDSSVVDTQVQVIRSRVVVGLAAERVGLPEEGEEQGLSRIEVIDAARDRLLVERVGLSHALSITYEDEDAERAALLSNAIAAAYLEHQLDVKQQATRDANEWLRQSVDELRSQLADAEAAVESYRARSGLLVAKGATSTESELTDFDDGLSNARRDLSDAEAQLAGYQGALQRFGPANAAEVVASPTMQQLRAQLGVLANQKAQMSPTFGALHPQMVELNRQIAGLQEQMNAEARRTIEELRSNVTIARNKVEGLLSIRDGSRRQLATDNSANLTLVELQSKAESLRALYEAMLSRFQQTASQESLGQINATIVSEAVVPTTPSSPNWKAILAGSLAIGVAFGVFAVLLAQLFDQTIVRPEDLERRTGTPLLALVPQLTKRDLMVGTQPVPIVDVVLEKPMSLFTESFRNLRVAVLGTVGGGEPIAVQLTSGTFAEGKTLCSIAFARTAARDGKRVLLIDGDTRRRSLTHYLGIDADAGLCDLLRGEVTFNDVVVSSGAHLPYVLPLARHSEASYDVFSTKAFEQLLVELKKRFDLIVIDSAPVLAVAEPISIASRVDAVVLVTRWSKTPVDVVLKTLEEIKRAGGRVVGTVLTHVDVKQVSSRAYGRKHYPALMKYYG
jgi:succinoglycan biosynthesis transport protein ExoP